MLAKMGYKEGDAIGKSSQGILEPIGIDIKKDRGGLGRDVALKQLNEHRQLIRLNRLKTRDGSNTISTEEFRKRMTEKAQGKGLLAIDRKVLYYENSFFHRKTNGSRFRVGYLSNIRYDQTVKFERFRFTGKVRERAKNSIWKRKLRNQLWPGSGRIVGRWTKMPKSRKNQMTMVTMKLNTIRQRNSKCLRTICERHIVIVIGAAQNTRMSRT